MLSLSIDDVRIWKVVLRVFD